MTNYHCSLLDGLRARWAACGLEMDDELTGEPSEAGADVEGMSAI